MLNILVEWARDKVKEILAFVIKTCLGKFSYGYYLNLLLYYQYSSQTQGITIFSSEKAPHCRDMRINTCRWWFAGAINWICSTLYCFYLCHALLNYLNFIIPVLLIIYFQFSSDYLLSNPRNLADNADLCFYILHI